MQEVEGHSPAEGPGDYEYDEAHDVPAAASPGSQTGGQGIGDFHIPNADETGDYSYDLAHDVPPAEPPH